MSAIGQEHRVSSHRQDGEADTILYCISSLVFHLHGVCCLSHQHEVLVTRTAQSQVSIAAKLAEKLEY